MPWRNNPDLWGTVIVFVLSAVSGLIAIANRLAAGQKFSWIWFSSQLSGALLAGYLVADAYPLIQEDLPNWCTQPISISLGAYFGGKLFSVAEKFFNKRTGLSLPEDTPSS
jgi:hypothetical protein